MKGKIYLIENQINHKQYIGKTYESIESRWQEHCHDYKKSRNEKRPLYDAMQKYGIENFTISLIEETDHLEEREVYWIAFYNTFKNGYNATLGGDGKPLYNYQLFTDEYKKGLLVKEIAQKFQCDEHTVTQGLRALGINGATNAINKTKNAVAQYDLNNNLIQTFSSQRDAARYLIENGSKGSITTIATNIGRVIKGVRKTAEGFVWKLL